MISIIVPAHNEESLIKQTIETLLASARKLDEPFELIVVDDASTDRTANIARSLGAEVIGVNLRKISAVRNAGARASQGDILIFVDADTLVPPETLRSAVTAVRDGAVGGGSRVFMEGELPKWAPPVLAIVSWGIRLLRLAAGCFLFARRDAFETVGGFDERYYASEEVHLSQALKKQGRFVIITDAVVTSGRKARLFSARQILRQILVLIRGGRKALKRRETLGFWYGGQRE